MGAARVRSFSTNSHSLVIHGALILAGPSRPDRGKAKVFLAALEDGAAEPEATKRKRKRSGRQAPTRDQEGDAVNVSDDGGEYSAPARDESEEEETDSDKDMVVDGAEVRS